jgi:hypothetical protein
MNNDELARLNSLSEQVEAEINDLAALIASEAQEADDEGFLQIASALTTVAAYVEGDLRVGITAALRLASAAHQVSNSAANSALAMARAAWEREQ